MFGTLVAKNHYDHIGVTILKVLMDLYGLLIVPTKED